MARWALTFGVIGAVVSGTVLIDVWRTTQEQGQRGVLMLGMVLLSMAFVLAPLVRRALGIHAPAGAPSRPRTLLDEMREAPDGTSEPIARAPEIIERPSASPLITRLVVAAYIFFGAVLLADLWAIRNF